MSRSDTARRIAGKITERVARVAPAGLGHWGPAWELVEDPSRAFLDALDRWEAAVDPTPAEEQELRDQVSAAAYALTEAWREAAARWEAEGRPVVAGASREPKTPQEVAP